MRGNNPCHMRPVTFAIIRPVGRVFANKGLYAQTLENSVRQFAITFLGLIGSNP